MPSSFRVHFTKRELIFLVVAALAIVAAVYLYSRSGESAPKAEEAAAQKAAEDVAKAENPFSAENPLVNVETNPFGKVKKVLNPFEQE